MSDDILPEFDQASVTAAANWLHERSQLDANQKSNSHEEMIAGILSEFVEFNNLQGIITNDNSSNSSTPSTIIENKIQLFSFKAFCTAFTHIVIICAFLCRNGISSFSIWKISLVFVGFVFDYLAEVGLIAHILSKIVSAKFHIGLPDESLEQTFKRLIQAAVHVPSHPGLLFDGYALVSSFFFSLAPTWSPHPNPLPPAPVQPQEPGRQI